MKLNVTHDLLVYVDFVNVMGGSERTVKKKAGILVVAIMEIGLKVNADTSKHVVMSLDQNRGQNK
jgi:hypothetical protein